MIRLRIQGRLSPTLAAEGQAAQSHRRLSDEGKVIAVYGFLDKVPAAQQPAQFVAAIWRGAIETSSIFGAVLARSAAPTPLLPE